MKKLLGTGRMENRRVKKVNHILPFAFLFLKEIFIERNIIEA